MGAAKEELETELRERRDAVRQGVKETQAAHKQETQEQVTSHKAASRSLIGPNQERNTLPSMAQHAAHATLRNDAAAMIGTVPGVNRADERWSALTKHVADRGDRLQDQDPS